jgi:hypothetical protein
VEPANYADEPAHFLNGILVRDYLTTALGTNPLTFAEQFYLDYPKIAPGVWGPVFHVLLGVFLLPGWPPHAAALALLALITAFTAWRLYRMVSSFARPIAAIFAGAIYLMVPLTVDLSSSVMLDIVVAAFALEATYWLAVYMSTERSKHAVLFGVMATLCCLTKGNGVMLVLMPPLLMALTGRYRLLKKPGLYISAAMLLTLAAPLLAISYRFDAAMGDFTGTGAVFIARRFAFYVTFLWHQLKPPFFLIALIGVWEGIRWARGVVPRWQVPVAPALVALAVAGLLFHVLLPMPDTEGRYIAMTLVALVGLVPLGVMKVTTRILSAQPRRAVQALVCSTLVLTMMTIEPVIAGRRSLGYQEVVDHLGAADALSGRRIVVISDASGEGAFVSEVAKRAPEPAATVIRGSKLLVESNWMGDHMVFLFTTPDALIKEMEDLHVDYLVFDASAAARDVPFWPLANAVVEKYGAEFEPAFATDLDRLRGPIRPLTLYRLTKHTDGPPKKVRVKLKYSIGTVIEK